jgi:hypothetical protein
MQNPIWQLQGSRAVLAWNPLEARLDLTSPGRGLGALRLRGADWPEAGLLGLDWQASAPNRRHPFAEIVSRAGDLLATCLETPDWPVRLDVVWRVRAPAPGDGFLAAVDLIVSVRTSLLDVRPEVSVRSALPACEIFCLAGRDAGEFHPVSLSPPRAFPAPLPGGAGCAVLRVPGKRPSYVEMVHPQDFPEGEIRAAGGDRPGDEAVALVHRLFARPLEKGVILRSRVRGLWVAREEDLDRALDSYRRFVASEPPLDC